MADVVRSAVHPLATDLVRRRADARLRRRRADVWVGVTGLVAAMIALPFGQNSWHSPEVAAILAVSATALLAGQRWAIAVVVLAELLLVPTMWPRAFFEGAALLPRVASLGALLAIVPGVLAMRRAATALVLVTGRTRTTQICRRFHTALVGVGIIATLLPLL